MTAQSDYERYARELGTLRKQIADASKSVASARKQESDARSQASRTTSESTARSKTRDAERYSSNALAAERKRADLESKAANKEKSMHDARAKADKARLDVQRKADKARDQSQRSALVQLEERLRSEQQHFARPLRAGDADSVQSEAPVKKYDIFISHASEDKVQIARPLFDALIRRGITIWFDEATLVVGDSLRRKIDEGLANSTFGVVILSPSFFSKSWPQSELDGLYAKQMSGQKKVILPVWHNISKDQILAVAPSLADTVGLVSAVMTVEEMADALESVVRGT